MKKILGLLMSTTIVTAGTAAVVACSTPVKKVPTYFTNSKTMLIEQDFVKWDKENKKYVNDTEAFNEWKAKKPVDQKQAISVGLNGRTGVFNRLRSDISNVLLYSGRETTKDNFLAHKESLKGADEGTSVDGIYSDILTPNPQEYYGKFQETQVSSLLGLYQLSKFVKDGKVDAATGVKASGDNLKVVEDNQEFFKSLAGEEQYASKNGSFTKIEYTFETGNADNQIAYIENVETIEQAKLKTGDYLSAETNIYDLSDDAANKAKGQTGNAAYDPFGQKTISPDLVVKVEEFKKAIFESKEKTDEFRKEYLTVSVDKLENLKFEYVSTQDKDNQDKYSLTVNNKLSYITEPTSINVKYVYNTDVDLKTEKEKGQPYTVEAKIDGIRAVYRPSVAGVKVEKDGTAKTQFGWVLVGYQFNGDKDSQVTKDGKGLETANKKTGVINFHDKFKDFKLSDLKVSDKDLVN